MRSGGGEEEGEERDKKKLQERKSCRNEGKRGGGMEYWDEAAERGREKESVPETRAETRCERDGGVKEETLQEKRGILSG